MITGSIVALVTPMQDQGEIDWSSLDRLIDFHIEQGTDSLVAVGTTGESATLDFSEHCAVVKHVVASVNGRIPVIAGTGANSTTEAIQLTQAAKDLGVDACLLVTPYYNKPTQEGLYQHFKAIAEAVDIPQILYNVPGRTVCDMLPQTVSRLSQVKNIVGIKEATGDLKRGQEVLDLAPEGFAVYSGDDKTAPEFILMGADGNISVTANVAPAQMEQVCKLAAEGKADEARALQIQLMPLHEAMFIESNPIPVKWALVEMGLIQSSIRLPLTDLNQNYQAQVAAALKLIKAV